MNVDFVPFIRGVRGLCKPRPDLAAAYFLSYKRPYYSLNVAMLTFSGGICKSVQFHLGNICKIGKYLTMTPYGNTYTCFCEF